MKLRLPKTQGSLLLAGMPFSINFAIAAQISGTITLSQLQNALERICRRHPILAVRVIAGEDGSAYLVNQGVPPISVKTVERASDDTWVRILNDEVAIPFDYRTGSPFRLVWLPGDDISDLILICDHLTADGRAGIYALRDLLSFLADSELNLEPIPPAIMADLIPPVVIEKIKAVITADSAAGPPTTNGWHDSPTDPKQVIAFTLTEHETTALVQRCRIEGVKVQSALCTAFLKPFAERQPSFPVRQVEIPVDIRDHLSQPVGEAYGMFISLVVLDLDCSPERDLWDIARDAQAKLSQAMRDEQFFYTPTLFITVTGKLPSGMEFGAGFDLSISNLGRVDIPPKYGPLTIRSVYAPIFNVSKSDHRVLGVTTFGKRIHCTYASYDPQAPQLVARSRALLAEMLRTSGGSE